MSKKRGGTDTEVEGDGAIVVFAFGQLGFEVELKIGPGDGNFRLFTFVKATYDAIDETGDGVYLLGGAFDGFFVAAFVVFIFGEVLKLCWFLP